jgi:DNA-binding NarL/FixJ family response regulator
VKKLTVRLQSLQHEGPSSIAREVHKDLEPELSAIKRELSLVASKLQVDPGPLRSKDLADAKRLWKMLSPREREVATRIAVGSSLKEIAAELELSDKTVSTYRNRILAKLGLRSNADLMRYAVENQSQR